MTLDPAIAEHRKVACQTFVEQTKLLMSLASAFIVAPPIVQSLASADLNWQFFLAELLFVTSVLSSYLTLGALTGTQHAGEYDVYRPAVMWCGRVQFFTYLCGLMLFGCWFFNN